MARMGDFRKKIKSLIHRYYSWLTLISKENQDGFESDYAKTDVRIDQVSFFIIGNSFVKRPPTLVVQFKLNYLTHNGQSIYFHLNQNWAIILKMTTYFRLQ